jgi:hypothetical protein
MVSPLSIICPTSPTIIKSGADRHPKDENAHEGGNSKFLGTLLPSSSRDTSQALQGDVRALRDDRTSSPTLNPVARGVPWDMEANLECSMSLSYQG